jgi:hypothetical protein
MNKTLVSIIIPTLGRPEKLHRLLVKIKENSGYDNYEVLVGTDEFPPNNMGVPKMVKKLVEQAKGDLVMYLGNDCVPEKNFLQLAVFRMAKTFPKMDGLVGLNDGYWKAGEFATHWLASKQLLPMLGGEFFHTGYFHCGCDNELTEMCRKNGKYVWAEEAKIDHDHPVKTGFKQEDIDDVYKLAYQRDRMEHDRDLLHERAKLLGFELHENFTEPTNIPKKIFTIWLNDKKTLPKDIKQYIQTHNVPGYEHKFITLNDCFRNEYVDSAIKTKQWAKAVDYLRCHYLVEEGGIYLDADVEVLPGKNFDKLLNNQLFAARENNGFIGNAVIGAAKGNQTLKDYLNEVTTKFKGDDNKVFEAAMEILTPRMEKDGANILTPEFFYPYDHQNNTTNITDNSITLHHFLKSWVK